MKHVMPWARRCAALCAAVLALLIFCTVFSLHILAPGRGTLSGAEQILPPSPLVIRPLPEQVDFSRQLAAFRKQNDDGKLWLYLPGTDISDEVVQAYDNNFYLRRSSLGAYYREHGCYFADYRNHLEQGEKKDRNIILYGHNIWDDGTKFSQLLAYDDWLYFAAHPYIYLQTLDGLRVFRVVCAYYTFTNFYYIVPNGPEERWAHVLDEAQKRSEFLTDLDLPADGHYLTLSTCCYKFYYPWGGRRHDQRFVVLGLEIDPENPPPYMFPRKNPRVKKPTDPN